MGHCQLCGLSNSLHNINNRSPVELFRKCKNQIMLMLQVEVGLQRGCAFITSWIAGGLVLEDMMIV